MRLLNPPVAQVDRIDRVAASGERTDRQVVGPIAITSCGIILELVAVVHFSELF